MTAIQLSGKLLAVKIYDELREKGAELERKGVKPHLTVILVGDNPASLVYVTNKTKMSREIGFSSDLIELPSDIAESALRSRIDALNRDLTVHGILLQLPLPPHLDVERILQQIDPAKDVDGLTQANLGALLAGVPRVIPCTPKGSMRLLEMANEPFVGRHAVVIGRSNIVGKPIALLLMMRNATVTICHSKTRHLPDVARSADILVVAVGQPNFVKGDWVKPGANVIDVGINRLENGRLVGDVATAEASLVAGAITPVPGGVGPMTIAMLLENTLELARLASEGKR